MRVARKLVAIEGILMDILHVANFSGNVGDNANHNGMRCKLSEVFTEETHYDELDMRRFYKNYDGKNKLYFDSDFVQLANKYDLVIIGGGNYFEVWLEDSSTGCTIDMKPEIVASLSTKVLFFGLGFDRSKGYSKKTLAHFLEFIKSLQDKNKFMVTIRNDGSLEQFVDSYGIECSTLVHKVPDGGFFVSPKKSVPLMLPEDRDNIILSLAMDMPSVRYGKQNEESGQKHLVDSFVTYIKSMIDSKPSILFTFMPHIFTDLNIINQVIGLLPDHIIRNHISVGPYLVGTGAENFIFSYYREADLAIAMRFHANVCPISMCVPTIGIGTYKKITDLYKELSLEDRLIAARTGDISKALLAKTKLVFSHKEKIIKENADVMIKINNEMANFLINFNAFISNEKSHEK